MAGRVLGSLLQQRLDDLLVEPPELCCPIMLLLFQSPVIASDGCAYEREAIARLIATGRVSPVTHEALDRVLNSSPALESNLEIFRAERAAQLLSLADEAWQSQTREETTLAHTALDRAKTYISDLPTERRQDMAARYLELCMAARRPIPTDLLLQVNPSAKLQISLRKADGTGGMISLDVQPSATLREVLNSAVGSASQAFTLNLMGKRLDLSRRLADYCIEGGSVLILVGVPESSALHPSAHTDKLQAWDAPGTPDHDRIYGVSGTLYGRCGGVWGVSAFVDRCMDSWMADPVLNANTAVASWHGKAQRCGFKFLVTQLMCKLMGGPQNYIGRDMATAHKHLNIDAEQWSSFMDIMGDVCKEFSLPSEDAVDLTSIILSMMDDCVLADGEVVPPNPGHLAPTGTSLFARLGGIYPIALFADRMVDAMLGDDRVTIPLDGTKRTESSLKYLHTEVVCHIAGGPGTLTSMRNSETFMQVSSKELFYLLVAAQQAADHFADQQAVRDLRMALYMNMNLFLDPKRTVSWDSPITFQCPKPHVRTYADMKRELDSAYARIGNCRALYSPGGLSHIDDGMTPEQQEQRNQVHASLGFVAARAPAVKSADAAAAGSGTRGV
jgi:hemoglobin